MRRFSPSLFGVVVAIAVGLLSSCSDGPDPTKTERSAWSCRTIARIPGPEDLVVDYSGEYPRLLVSSDDRDAAPTTDGAIYSVSLSEPADDHDPSARPWPILLPLAGRDRCSFHPHGISLVQSDATGNPWLLYVINHHEPKDASPEAGCFPHPAPTRRTATRITSIEVFIVEKRQLVFVQRLAQPDVLTNGNDLVALGDGRIWVTNPPVGGFQLLYEALIGHVASKVVYIDCTNNQSTKSGGSEAEDLRCRDRWCDTWKDGRYVNGIAYAALPRRLFVASTAGGGVLHVLETTAWNCPKNGGQERGGLREVQTIPLGAGPDNLEWLDSGHQLLLAATHPDLRRFLQHFSDHRVQSPSEVRTIRVDQDSSACFEGDPILDRVFKRYLLRSVSWVPASRIPEIRQWKIVFRDDGGLISGASTATCFDGDLILGQVFGPAVLRCQGPHSPCPAEGQAAAGKPKEERP